MKRNQSIEDYLEDILLLSRETEYVHRVDVARKAGVSQPAVQKAVKILTCSGFVECDGMHIYLTPGGREYAEKIYNRHVTLREFLKSLGVNEKDASDSTCSISQASASASFSFTPRLLKNSRRVTCLL